MKFTVVFPMIVIDGGVFQTLVRNRVDEIDTVIGFCRNMLPDQKWIETENSVWKSDIKRTGALKISVNLYFFRQRILRLTHEQKTTSNDFLTLDALFFN